MEATPIPFSEQCSLLAPLANVAGHTLGLNLGQGFVVERWSVAKLLRALTDLEWLPSEEILYRLDEGKVTRMKPDSWYRSDSVYVVTSSRVIEAKDILDAHKVTEEISQALEQKLKLVRLFYSGGIKTYGIFWYVSTGSANGELVNSVRDEISVERNTTNLTRWGVARLNEVLNSVQMPFRHSYLNLAIEHFEIANQSGPLHMRFLALMIGIEVLFNLGPQDIRYRIARSLAVLIGECERESDELFERMKKLYDLRSKIVHTGASKKITEDDVWWAQHLLRKSIVSAYQSNLDKQQLMEALSRAGHGAWRHRPWHWTLQSDKAAHKGT